MEVGPFSATGSPEIHVARDPCTAAALAGAQVIALVEATANVRGAVSIALSGGTTPRLLYEHLVTVGRNAAPWDLVTFCFGDERCVPQEDAESNAGTAWRELLLPLGVRPAQVVSVPPGAPDVAAERYEASLRKTFGSETPRLDLVLLGVGADGHVASLFPGDPVLEERFALARAVEAPANQAITRRVTLTLPVINNAHTVFFLATGEGKRNAVTEALNPTGPSRSPAARVQPDGRLAWFLDAAAAPIL